MTEEPKIVSLEAFRLSKQVAPTAAPTPDFKADMVALLKETIAEVESGKLSGFVLACGYEDSSSVDVRGRVTGPEALWLLERMKKAILP
jgi:cob(I)alamin adenosyltransferase